jgi:hypothetical protein
VNASIKLHPIGRRIKAAKIRRNPSPTDLEELSMLSNNGQQQSFHSPASRPRPHRASSSILFRLCLRTFVEGDTSTYGGEHIADWLHKIAEPFAKPRTRRRTSSANAA